MTWAPAAGLDAGDLWPFKDASKISRFERAPVRISANCSEKMDHGLDVLFHGFYLTYVETAQTSSITSAAYDAWVLVNDYFSWEKEYKNYEANGSTGQIVSAVFLFMKWHDIDPITAKKMLRGEIIVREERYCQLKADYLARGNVTDRIIKWFKLLDFVTAGNFAWSMTTARYHDDVEDAYPGLRAVNQKKKASRPFSSLSTPITSLTTNAKKENSAGSETPDSQSIVGSSTNGEASTAPTSPASWNFEHQSHDIPLPILAFEEVSPTASRSRRCTKQRLDCAGALCLFTVSTVEGSEERSD